MKLTKNTVRLLVALMIVALGGLIFLQVRLFLNNVELKHEAFRRNVVSALNDAAAKLEEIDLRDRFFTVKTEGPIRLRRPSDVPFYSNVFITSEHGARTDTARKFSFTSVQKSLSTRVEGDRLTYNLDQNQRVRVALFDVLGRVDTILVDEKKRQGTYEVRLPQNRGLRILKVETDSASSVFRWEGKAVAGYVADTNVHTVGNIVLRVAETFKSGQLPVLARRLRPGLVDSVLKEQFNRNGIDLPVAYAVFALPQDSLLFGNADLTRRENRSDSYTTMLFAGDFSGNAGELVVRFPTYGAFLFTEFLPELILNILFLAVVTGSFWFTVRILVRQKEFAGRLSDFINNMTHEFKTPLSTIALASEALHRSDVLQSKAKIRRYNRIIGEEYERMRGQVDKILDMAALEEGDVEFHREPVDLHALVLKTAEHASLEIAKRGGTLLTELKAARRTILADAIHLENALRSVLDNAVKYSPAVPEISISTENIQDTVLVRISDRGIGIAREHQQRVFEKYFRVPTGNIHDIKGFGLGLSYVRLVTEAHGGKAVIESESGKGTTVTLRLPVAAP
jgi:signal transduction histidine kinase